MSQSPVNYLRQTCAIVFLGGNRPIGAILFPSISRLLALPHREKEGSYDETKVLSRGRFLFTCIRSPGPAEGGGRRTGRDRSETGQGRRLLCGLPYHRTHRAQYS